MLLATIQLTLLRITYPTYNTVAQGGGGGPPKKKGGGVGGKFLKKPPRGSQGFFLGKGFKIKILDL